MEYNDGSPNPLNWSPGRLQRWLRAYRHGRFAVLLDYDFFMWCDGQDACALDKDAMHWLVADSDRHRSVLVAATSQLRKLASANTTGKPSCAVHRTCVAL